MALEVDRADLRRTRLVDLEPVELADGSTRLRVDRFGLSSNNVTYAAMGDAMRYWQFFPSGDPAWGRLPVWGFAQVVESRAEGVDVGRRVFGYLPCAEELVVSPARVDAERFIDAAAHRADLPSTYNGYRFCEADPVWRADREHHQMLFVPLFFTSFVVEDFVFDRDYFGATQLVLTSASSKTSIGVAERARARGVAGVVGMTSPGNRAFCEGLGCYDRVVAYDEVDGLDRTASVLVDVAGSSATRDAVHARLEGVLAHSMLVGITHWDEAPTQAAPPVGPRPEFLFAPVQLKKRTQDWGRAGLDERIAAAFDEFCTFVDRWIRYVDAEGPAEVAATYEALVRGDVDPAIGHVGTLEP